MDRRVAGCFSHLATGVVAHTPIVRSHRRSGSGYTTVFESLRLTSAMGAPAARVGRWCGRVRRVRRTIRLRCNLQSSGSLYTRGYLERTYGVNFDSQVADCEGCPDALPNRANRAQQTVRSISNRWCFDGAPPFQRTYRLPPESGSLSSCHTCKRDMNSIPRRRRIVCSPSFGCISPPLSSQTSSPRSRPAKTCFSAHAHLLYAQCIVSLRARAASTNT